MPVPFRPFGSRRVDQAATGAGRFLSSGPFGSPTGSLAWADLASLTYAPFPSAAMRPPLCGFALRRKPTKDPVVSSRITPPPPPRQDLFSPTEQSFRVGPPPEGGNLLSPRVTPLATRSLAGPWKAPPHQHPINTPSTRGVFGRIGTPHGVNGSHHGGGGRGANMHIGERLRFAVAFKENLALRARSVCAFAHLYPAPQHVVSTRMRQARKRGEPRPYRLGLYRMLNLDFGEFFFHDVG